MPVVKEEVKALTPCLQKPLLPSLLTKRMDGACCERRKRSERSSAVPFFINQQVGIGLTDCVASAYGKVVLAFGG